MNDAADLSDNMIARRMAAVARSKTFKRIVAAFALDQKRVLDIGCAYGEYLASFGAGSVGITAAAHEVQSGARRGLSIRFGNAEDIGQASASFDAIWANNLFEHLLSPHPFLMGLRRSVRDGGMIILGVPVLPFPAFLMRLRRFRGALATSHINFFTAKTLALTVERAGWKIQVARSFAFGPVWLDRIAGPFMPHCYIVAVKDSSFAYHSKKVMEWKDDPRYQHLFDLASS